MHTLSKSHTQVEYLHAVPGLSSCSDAVLEEFVRHGAVELHVAAGEHMRPAAGQEQSTYVLVAGSALMASNDVVVTLDPGDYLGGATACRFHIAPAVIALSDLVFVVVTPWEVDRLNQASCRDRHPSQTDWRSEFPLHQ